MSKEFSVEQIKELIGVLAQNRMKTLKVKSGDYSITIEGSCESAQILGEAAALPQMQVAAPPAESAAVSPPPALAASGGNVVTSPMVGTFYGSPSPEDPPFVTVGQHVSRGDVLFIIEAMKLMNEVTSPHDGIVTEVYMQNAQAVEYGQPVMTIK